MTFGIFALVTVGGLIGGMTDRRLLMTGCIGVGVAALCCFTPVLVALLGVVGLSAAAGWLDFVLLPVMAVFVAIIVYALVRKRPA